ncbi:ectonucleotide pyrophosphatase/phosphodiesterase [Phenylobacterium sp.]|uniref:alkaline phosphatase family protein n=1 Tax=Phenylobacterium sp. TaxID=1871053 RepID=UPI00272FABC6|nr:ectonucleotide pyrophosphatase/phosphodiesterase [Phenylobacterium sp.]MDP1988993.1 ectonucleotide pyrophosphatase/phosphodiesterase [Phenylobacterium sp.]
MIISALRPVALLVLLLGLTACATPRPAPRAEVGAGPGPVILISIDGFRSDYLDRGLTPHLGGLADRGLRAPMRASFPTKTFPNHYTLVTGLTPARHGLVDNIMRDPDHPGRLFRLGDRSEVTDPLWWEEGLPIWVSAERAGLKTATLFWPGSEAAIHGVRPSHWRTFDQSMSAEARVDQLLAWLDVPAAEQPAFLALYFDEVDTDGHRYGPDAPELNAALARTDAAIGRLVAGLEARGLLSAANLIVVSDHGMAPTSRDRVIYLEDLVSVEDGQVLSTGPHLTFEPARGREAQAAAALLRDHAHMSCWRKAELPERFAYRHRRVASLFCLAETGWEILPRDVAARRPQVGGAHGFDPDDPTMTAIFVAAGPAFRVGIELPRIDNVDVYPLLSRLLALQPAPHQGDLTAFAPGLALD